MDKKKINLTVILLLMVISGLIIYFMYLKPENFACPTNTSGIKTDPTCTEPTPSLTPIITCPPPKKEVPLAILSRYFGAGFNVYPVSTSDTDTDNIYLIEHQPINSTEVLGSCYAVSGDNLLSIKIKNINDPTQFWKMKDNVTDPKDNRPNTPYIIMQPNNISSMALQYANGSLSITPYSSPGFESQRFIKSTKSITRGKRVFNYSPSCMFTTEFDLYSAPDLTSSNNQQTTDVVNAVKSSIEQYLTKMNSTQPTCQVSTSLGNKDMPLSVNLNLGGYSKGVSNFFDVTGSTSNSDFLSILDKYDSQSVNQNNSTNDLQNQLNTDSSGCKLLNINDYTSKRVSTCNACKL